ncbi:Glutamate decarboxylase [Termitomyces sp. T112]|nr:Glutamate decarboxylase [Termitomyces sp. T112]
MALSKHVIPDKFIREPHDKTSHYHGLTNADLGQMEYTYGARYATNPIPKYRIPSKPRLVKFLSCFNRFLQTSDGSPVLNLASFVSTWMPPEADRLFHENVSKNLVGISILADLWHAPSAKNAVGTATTGSSEAIQLCGLAMKKMWQEKCKAAGKSIHEPGPNIVMGANAQVALEKFARYFEVECRLVPVSVESHYRLDSSKVMEYVDENTIGVFVILGSTYTGHYEPVKEISDLLDEYEAKTGHYVPIHVDAASGGFVAPFATPKHVWDFKLPRVVSINSSGHKFGLSYVGVGWVIWRDKAHLPKELIFELHYLGSVEYSFSLNFSRPAAPIITQYFNLINLGFEGYRTVALNDLKNARLLSRALEGGKYYTVLSDIHRKIAGPLEISNGISEDDPELYHLGLPVVSFRFSDEFKENYPEVQQRWIQTLLRAKGWIVPNYELPPALEQVEILRVVVKENMTQVLVDQFVADLLEVTESLAHAGTPLHSLNMLDQVRHKRSKPEHHAGALEGGSSEKSSGTYARPCRRKWASTPLREFPRDALHHE